MLEEIQPPKTSAVTLRPVATSSTATLEMREWIWKKLKLDGGVRGGRHRLETDLTDRHMHGRRPGLERECGSECKLSHTSLLPYALLYNAEPQKH